MKTICTILLCLTLAPSLIITPNSAYAAEILVEDATVRRGTLENLPASRVQDNESTLLRTDRRGRFSALFSFNAATSDSAAKFTAHIDFKGRGKYRFFILKPDGSLERFPRLINPTIGFQTLTFQTIQPISAYVNNGAVTIGLTTSRRSSPMGLDYLSLNTGDTEQPPRPNNPPVANAIQANTLANTATNLNILDSASDPDGDALTVGIAAQPSNGTAELVGEAMISYTPNNGFIGTDNFTYSVNDGRNGTATASISITVTEDENPDVFRNIPLVSSITGVQPMTGIVLWTSSHNETLLKTSNEYTQLEFSYLDPSNTVVGDAVYDWSSLDTLLDQVQNRGKQAVLRWSYVLPGSQTTVPDYIKALPDYNETSGITEGQQTFFPDWSNQTFQNAHIDLYSAFAARYDNDPRIAFLQVGFGLWGEYHIYEPGVQLGVNFPSKSYQTSFLNHLDNVFKTLKWSISIDAGVESNTPLNADPGLMGLEFGLFDDSFMHQSHGNYNEIMWDRFGYTQRYEHSVHGGEFSYYTDFDQRNVLNADGIHGRKFEDQSAKFHITYMIGNDQPEYQSNERIRDAGLNTGYRFEVTSFQASSNQSKVTVRNIGVAPIYYDAYLTVNNVSAATSLKGLLPGASAEFTIASGGSDPVLSIESDRLVGGQVIGFEANL